MKNTSPLQFKIYKFPIKCQEKTKTCILSPKHYKQTSRFYLYNKICFIFSTEKFKKSDLKA